MYIARTHTKVYIYIYIYIYTYILDSDTHTHIYIHTWKLDSHTHIYMCWIYIYIYIVVHEHTILLYRNSSLPLETRVASTWDRNQADFTAVEYLTAELSSLLTKEKGFSRIYIYTLPANRVLNLCEEICIISPAVPFIHRSWQALLATSSVWIKLVM